MTTKRDGGALPFVLALASVVDILRCGGAGFELDEGGGDGAVLVLPGVVFLETAASAATRLVSFVENMRVKRSLTEAFSAGFGNCSVEPVGTDWPFWAARCGDLEERSKDLMDEVCEGEVRCEDADLASEVLLAMVADFRGGTGFGSLGGCDWGEGQCSCGCFFALGDGWALFVAGLTTGSAAGGDSVRRSGWGDGGSRRQDKRIASDTGERGIR